MKVNLLLIRNVNSYSNCQEHIISLILICIISYSNINIIFSQHLIILKENIGHKDMKFMNKLSSFNHNKNNMLLCNILLVILFVCVTKYYHFVTF